MAVSTKIITGNDQPRGGRAVVGVAGARGLDSASLLDANHTLEPEPLGSANIDQPIADIDAKLDERFDDPRYYSGDAIT
jgi:hypothetical protein